MIFLALFPIYYIPYCIIENVRRNVVRTRFQMKFGFELC